MKNGWGEDVGIFILKRGLAQAIFEPNPFPV